MKVQLTSNLYNIDSVFGNLLVQQINTTKIPVINKYPKDTYNIEQEYIVSYVESATVEDGLVFIELSVNDIFDQTDKFTPVLNNDETVIIAVKHSTM
jgi:hypothetical protein